MPSGEDLIPVVEALDIADLHDNETARSEASLSVDALALCAGALVSAAWYVAETAGHTVQTVTGKVRDRIAELRQG